MNTNVRIGLCALGFFFPTLIPFLIFGVFLDLGIYMAIFGGGIIAIIIFFVTGIELSSSKFSTAEKQIDGTTVILLYILSFFIPLAGFIVGAIYASKDEEHYKHVGKNCLIFSVINIVLGFIMIVAIIAG